jgi:hypothetical protein
MLMITPSLLVENRVLLTFCLGWPQTLVLDPPDLHLPSNWNQRHVLPHPVYLNIFRTTLPAGLRQWILQCWIKSEISEGPVMMW